jgi:hypothetical protein
VTLTRLGELDAQNTDLLRTVYPILIMSMTPDIREQIERLLAIRGLSWQDIAKLVGVDRSEVKAVAGVRSYTGAACFS